MSVYLDTSVLVSIYYPESITAKVKTFLKGKKGLTSSTFSIVEFSSAINRKVLRRELSKQSAVEIINRFEDNIDEGYYKICPFSQGDLVAANNFIIDNLGRVSLRTVDALHIAVALRYKCEVFVTADKAQAKSSEILGLKTKFICL
ncbi:MAG TPA: type II toxin-antitoxin system VapC family toxin [Thermodesulfobacteriota bacterium]|nr:type II toxin-antitoxin system VapC family toxin [Thermodesulfobacteriota bacterium]